MPMAAAAVLAAAAAAPPSSGWHSAANYDVTYDCPGPCANDTETCHCRQMVPQVSEAACRDYCDAHGCVAYAYQASAAKPYPNGTRECWWRTDNFFNSSFTWGNATSCPPPVKAACHKSGDASGCKSGVNPATKQPWVPGCGTNPPFKTGDEAAGTACPAVPGKKLLTCPAGSTCCPLREAPVCRDGLSCTVCAECCHNTFANASDCSACVKKSCAPGSYGDYGCSKDGKGCCAGGMHVSKTLPNCLLIGDSVAHGTFGEAPWNFTGSVQDLLKDKCPVSNVESVSAGGEMECFWSTSTDAATGKPVPWKVIHYNEGLHSLWPRVHTSTELAAYAATLGNFTEALKATGATLVYATMTPFEPQKFLNPSRPNDPVDDPQNDVEMKNALAVKTVKAHGVTLIDDLFTAVTDVCGKVYKNCSLCDNESAAHPGITCGFHYSPTGWRLLSKQTVSYIEKAMAVKSDDDEMASGSVLIEAHCDSALRIRIAPPGGVVQKEQVGALSEECAGSNVVAQRLVGAGELVNGNVKAVATATSLIVTRVSDGATLLSGPMPTFGAAVCGTGYHSINASFTTGGNASKWYGLGQLGSSGPSGGQPNCEDPAVGLAPMCTAHADTDIHGGQRIASCSDASPSCLPAGATQQQCCDACTMDKTCKQWIYAPAAQGKHPKGACWLMAVAGLPRKSANRISGGASSPVPPHSSGSGECVVPLERSGLGPVSISSVKYWIAIPWIFNLDGWGVFLNQPGDGMMDASSGLKATFTCQKQLDLWVTAAPTAAPNRFLAVFNSYAHATGLPSPLPDNGALYWQSRDAYKSQAEVIGIAKNFTARNLSVGVIVIDLGPPNAPPYYRLDPARFPDVAAMSKQVAALTGADLMPNLKPTSVTSSDCPACGSGHSADGKADDGNIDASAAACRSCVWEKRLKPALYDKGVKTYWLDDDEANKFKFNGPKCKPTTANGSPCSSSSCCKSGFCDPNVEKCAPHHADNASSLGLPGSLAGGMYSCGPAQYCEMAMAGKLWPQMYADGIKQEGGADAAKPLILSRNAWAGAAAHGVALWSSDIACSWTEFRAQVTVGLSSGLSGIPFWSSDVGGFSGKVPTTPELVARWHQFGSVCPLYRSHGSRAFNEPWSFGPQAEASITKSNHLRTSLKPYVMEMAANATAYGTPIMVPLWFYFSDDPELQKREVTTEFMFGPKYLAAPVLEKGATTRTLYLPKSAGGWVHYYSRKQYAGGANVTVPAPFDELPLFVKV